MKIKLLLLAIAFACFSTQAQILSNNDDFEDGTTMGWFESGASPNPPSNIADGGPMGAGDNYLEDLASGAGGPGSRMVIRNTSQWIGDFTSEGVVEIRFDARATGNNLNLRIAMNGSGGPISTTNAQLLTAGTGWTTISIPIQASDMQTVTSNVGSGFDINATLADVVEFRILSNSVPSYAGESVAATLDVDNIIASTTLSAEDFQLESDFKMSPNPGSSMVNLKVPSRHSNFDVEVYDVLGKRIFARSFANSEGIMNVSNWNNGVYLVRISNDDFSQTKRFVKQ